jgi:hypothetical protein
MATYLGEIQRKQMTNRDPYFINTQTLRFQHVTKAFQCAIICAPSYKELEKTVNQVLEGHICLGRI